MKYLSVISILLIVILSHACKKKDGVTQEEDNLRLEEQFESIKKMSESVTCEDASDWKFTSYGSKACGGPIGFIAYSTKIDTDSFLKKVKAYSQAQSDYNERWDVFSDCSVPVQPNNIRCEDGGAILERL